MDCVYFCEFLSVYQQLIFKKEFTKGVYMCEII